MKKLLLTSIFVTGILATSLFAQRGFTLVGGLNLGSIKYNNDNVDNDVDISTKTGLILGVESTGGPLNMGVAYIQRGAKFKAEFLYDDIRIIETYNYLSGYVIIPISIQKVLSVFGGGQIGICLGGTSEMESGGESMTYDLEGEDFAIDLGLLFGADYMFNTNIGIRASYYLGLADVADGVESNYNFKNRGIAINLLYKI